MMIPNIMMFFRQSLDSKRYQPLQITINREVKHDVNGRRQTAKITLILSSFLLIRK